jgi:hypothetical protein
MPGPSHAALAVTVGLIGLASLELGLSSSGSQPFSLGYTLTIGALLSLTLARAEERRRKGTREVAMAIVPWGVLVEPDTDPRVLRWPAVRSVGVQVLHTMHGGTPAVVSSVVTVRTFHESLAGRTAGPVGLEGLTVNLEAYAEEAARPVALDLEGFEASGNGATEPVMADLLRRAADLCESARGAAHLGLPPGGYRSVASRTAAPETIALLRRILGGSLSSAEPADPRPLAAIVAARLGASALVPDLLRLVSSPHPVVAAVAKAAAIRLGAPRNRAGAIEEVAAFLFEEDYDQISRWAEGSAGRPSCAVV